MVKYAYIVKMIKDKKSKHIYKYFMEISKVEDKTRYYKKENGQFYTTNYKYILDGLDIPKDDNIKYIIEPFAGKGDLVQWCLITAPNYSIKSYDIDPKYKGVIVQDTLKEPPNYKDSFVVTNPPYLARNKTKSKDLFDKYKMNDLYKCFIMSLCEQNNCKGGILIIPSGFFLSSRPIDIKCRDNFMSKFKIQKVKYFEERVFDDTPTTVVAFSFIRMCKKSIKEQNVKWIRMPSNEIQIFNVKKIHKWIIGGEIYNLPKNKTISISRYVEGKPLKNNEQQTYMTIRALDGGNMNNRIHLDYEKNYIYPAKNCSRTYATLVIKGITLTEKQQQNICRIFNIFIEEKRVQTWSLFLPQFRESKEYTRKRIPFTLVYNIVCYIIDNYNIDE